MNALELHPIGIYHSQAKYPYDVPRQGTLVNNATGIITLEPGHGYEQALKDLDGFSHIWLIFWFHHNQNWTTMTRPPRHLDRKVGTFASRSPYRPNPIGLSAVKLIRISRLELTVAGCDLLDGTPILDIKPYLPYADAFPQASPGWTAETPVPAYQFAFSPQANQKVEWLEKNGVPCLRQFITDRLEFEPMNAKRHRLILKENGLPCLAYRTWRISFCVQNTLVTIQDIFSGYSAEELDSGPDKYNDHSIHLAFIKTFYKIT